MAVDDNGGGLDQQKQVALAHNKRQFQCARRDGEWQHYVVICSVATGPCMH